MVEMASTSHTVTPHIQTTLKAMVTIGHQSALAERKKIHRSIEKIKTIKVPNTAIWLRISCICPIMDGVPTG